MFFEMSSLLDIVPQRFDGMFYFDFFIVECTSIETTLMECNKFLYEYVMFEMFHKVLMCSGVYVN